MLAGARGLTPEDPDTGEVNPGRGQALAGVGVKKITRGQTPAGVGVKKFSRGHTQFGVGVRKFSRGQNSAGGGVNKYLPGSKLILRVFQDQGQRDLIRVICCVIAAPVARRGQYPSRRSAPSFINYLITTITKSEILVCFKKETLAIVTCW